jgi:hypothetical protein
MVPAGFPARGRPDVRYLGKTIKGRNSMAKKPPNLTLIGPEQPEPRPNPLEPPAQLKETGRDLWLRIHRDFVVDDAHGLEALYQVCVASDRAQECAEAIARDGVTIKTRSGLRDHPLIRHETQMRSFICRSLARMGFDVVAPRAELGRPSGDGSYRGGS